MEHDVTLQEASIVLEMNHRSLEHLHREWLLTNALGGFASGTVSGINTRRYHSHLVAAMRPPVQRVNTVNQLGEILHIGEQTYELFSHEFRPPEFGVNAFHPQGFTYLTKFEKHHDHVVWHYDLPELHLSKTLQLGDGTNICRICYAIMAEDELPPVRMTVIPFLSMRDFHALQGFTEDEIYHIAYGGGHVHIDKIHEPSLSIEAGAGMYHHRPDWWYQFLYRIDAQRGQDCVEDLFTPGYFVWEPEVRPGDEALWQLTLSAHDPHAEQTASTSQHAAEQLRPIASREQRRSAMTSYVANQLPKDQRDQSQLAMLCSAADDFIVERHGMGDRGWTIIAGYPWFTDWGRDTMIALPGLMLCTGRFDDAQATLAVFAEHIRRGLVPNTFDDRSGAAAFNTVDASLWFVHAAFAYRIMAGHKAEAFFQEVLLPACREILMNYHDGTDYEIHADPADGLIYAGNADTQLTWMDAMRDGVVFTPRFGKAVEINALWYHGLTCMAKASPDEKHWEQWAKQVRQSFKQVFAPDDLPYLLDHVTHDHADRSLRPNQCFAVAVAQSPLDQKTQRSVMNVVTEHLLTPRGLRTLPTDDPNYHGRYEGSMFDRDRAYHQGTTWAWLIGPFVEGYLRAYKFSDRARSQMRKAIEPMMQQMHEDSLGQLHEIFDGDPPHNPQGTFAQAWSISELLRSKILIEADANHPLIKFEM